MTSPPYDPRIVANCILEIAWDNSIEVTHLALQKTAYFLHARFLRERDGVPLLSGHFEAWKHGPVHPQLWSSFKEHGRSPIEKFATAVDLFSGLAKELPEIDDPDVKQFIIRGCTNLLKMEPHKLVGLSHAKNSPWDVLTRSGRTERVYGCRISNELIRERFHFHKISMSDNFHVEEEIYEQPPS